jgi:hypothetical protein
MQRRACTTMVACLALTWMVTSGRPAFGEPLVSRSAPTVGATVGIVGTGDRLNGGGKGVMVTGHVDLPTAPAWRVRLGGARLPAVKHSRLDS